MRRTAVLALPVTATLLLAGCGTDRSHDAEAEAEAVPAGVTEQYEVLAQEVADRGGQATEGDWTVSYIVEAAEPWFEKHGEHSTFREPRSGETHHIEIIPTETETGRIVPDVPITLALVDASGEVVEEQPLSFYYSTFFHYANNFHVRKPGTYTLRAVLGSPTFNRHGDPADGPALGAGVTVEFPDVELALS